MPRAAVKPSKTKTTPYDVAEHLRTPKEMAAYLDAWLAEVPTDAAGIAKALGDIARAKGMSQVAKDAGLSRESLYRALSADGNPRSLSGLGRRSENWPQRGQFLSGSPAHSHSYGPRS